MSDNQPKAYKFLTGTDDAVFCQRVSDALRDGYLLYGPPIMQVDANGERHCGQAVVLAEMAATYSKN